MLGKAPYKLVMYDSVKLSFFLDIFNNAQVFTSLHAVGKFLHLFFFHRSFRFCLCSCFAFAFFFLFFFSNY